MLRAQNGRPFLAPGVSPGARKGKFVVAGKKTLKIIFRRYLVEGFNTFIPNLFYALNQIVLGLPI